MRDLDAPLARLRVPLGFLAGICALWLARPTRTSLVAGSVVAVAGEAVRIWAAGHLRKGREVTRSGPYRWVRHPLYLGSSLMGFGLAIASARLAVGALVVAYLWLALSAAIRIEERSLRAAFGDEYDDYVAGRATAAEKRFSLARVMANREYRALIGLVASVATLVLKMWMLAPGQP